MHTMVTCHSLRSAFFFILICRAAGAGASNRFGKQFLKENAKRAEVISLPSGLQYKVLRTGVGDSHPTVNSPCACHYVGRTAQNWPDGNTFDSSYARGSPATFAPNQVIRGWTEAMQLMVEGDKWEMYIPSELGYGDLGHPPNIGGGDVLVFTMEIVKIKGGKSKKQTTPAPEMTDISENETTFSASGKNTTKHLVDTVIIPKALRGQNAPEADAAKQEIEDEGQTSERGSQNWRVAVVVFLSVGVTTVVVRFFVCRSPRKDKA